MANLPVPSPIYPNAARFLNIAKESVYGTPSAGTYVEIPSPGSSPTRT